VSQISRSFSMKCTPSELQSKIELMTLVDKERQMIRLANLCFVSCNKIVFCSPLQRDILYSEPNGSLKEFYGFLNKSFILIEPGVNPRKWIHNCNRDLSALISDYIDDESEWLTHMQLLRPLINQMEDFNKGIKSKSFFTKFMNVRQRNKKRIVGFLRKELGADETFLTEFDLGKTLFSGFLKKFTKSARHLLLVLWVIVRYQEIKQLVAQGKQAQILPRVIVVGGYSRPGDTLFLQLIKLLNKVATILRKDPQTNRYLRVVFCPNYTTAKEYRFVPALDVNEQLTLPGKQGCSTQALKFAMNGSLLLGSRDSTNMRVQATFGEHIPVLFG
jgi:glycogen phosphorylase